MDLAAVLAAGRDFGADLATGAGLLILTAVLALDLSATGFISDFFCTGEAVGFADWVGFVGLVGFTGFTFFTDLDAGVGFTRDADLAAAAGLADLADLDGVTRGAGLADFDLGTGLAGVFLAAGLAVFCGLTAADFFCVGVGF
jgi:hypothetical protein